MSVQGSLNKFHTYLPTFLSRLASHVMLFCTHCLHQACSEIVAFLKSGKGRDESAGGTSVAAFAALHYLRKLCSHPQLMLDWQVRVVSHHPARGAGVRHLYPTDSQKAEIRGKVCTGHRCRRSLILELSRIFVCEQLLPVHKLQILGRARKVLVNFDLYPDTVVTATGLHCICQQDFV